MPISSNCLLPISRVGTTVPGLAAAGLALVLSLAAPSALAQSEDAEALSPRLLFAISGGFWETVPSEEAAEAAEDAEAADEDAAADAGEEAAADQPTEEGAPEDAAPEEADAAGRGYYRALAYRSDDDTSLLYIQQVALTDAGPEIVETTEVEEITTLGAYITDLRPEDSTGVAATPGFTAFIYLKTDPEIAQPETWELFIDEFGEMRVDGATN